MHFFSNKINAGSVACSVISSVEVTNLFLLLLQRRNDREEIRRRLAMGSEDADYYSNEQRPTGKKPSLQARLQSGMLYQFTVNGIFKIFNIQ